MTGTVRIMTLEQTRQQRLGAAIRAARNHSVWSQQELADRIESSQSYISLLEKGRVAQPGMRILSKIAFALNLDLNDLLVNSGWPDVSAYVAELQEAQEALGGMSGKRIEIIEMLSELPEGDAEKIWSYASYLCEEQAHYDGPTEILEGEWGELFRLAPQLPKDAARTFVGIARLMIPEQDVERAS